MQVGIHVRVGEEESVSEYVEEGCAEHVWVQANGQIHLFPWSTLQQELAPYDGPSIPRGLEDKGSWEVLPVICPPVFMPDIANIE